MKVLLIYFLLINLVGFLMMYTDKRKAIKGEWRTPESTLFLVALIGGAIGGTIGMRRFKHKTQHTAFAFGFPILALVESLLLLYWII